MRKYLKPLDGLIVRMPGSNKPVPKDGAWFELSGKEGSFYKRRIADKSLIEVDEPKAVKTEQPEKIYFKDGK